MFDLSIQDFDGEPRMRDIEIAEALGFGRGRDLRKLIDRSVARLEEFGLIIRATVARIDQPGPNPEVYWLNEHQAFYICTQSKTEKAFEVTREIITLFVAWRNGHLPAPGDEPSVFTPDADTTTHLSLLREVRLLHGCTAARQLYARLPLPQISDEAQAAPPDDCEISIFLREKCVVTGNSKHWTRSLALYQAYLAFYSEAGNITLSKRGFANRLRAISVAFRCPDTGARFPPHKSNGNTGYSGIRLIAAP